MRSSACRPLTIPSAANCLAMKVMARVLTTPYTVHTTSHAQWRFHRLVWLATNAHPRSSCRRAAKRRTGVGNGISATDGHLLLVLVLVDAPARERHEHVLQVGSAHGRPQLLRRPFGDDASTHEKGD